MALKTDSQKRATVTLDEVFAEMQYWRDHKDEFDGYGIPDGIWSKIFQLETGVYSATQLRRLFSLNSQQYIAKKKQLSESGILEPKPIKVASNIATQQALPCSPDNKLELCEALISEGTQADSIPSLTEKSTETKKAITQLKSTQQKPENYLDMTTIIVECIRPDGHRLKIHTTTQSIDKVMQGFIQQGATTA